MARFNLTAGSASEASQQLTEQRTEIATMKMLRRAGALEEKGGRSDTERIRDAEEGLKRMEQQYKTRFGHRR
jgi:hypothetical protein